MTETGNCDTHRVDTDRKLMDDMPQIPSDPNTSLKIKRKQTFTITGAQLGEKNFCMGHGEEEAKEEAKVIKKKTSLFGIKDEIDNKYNEENPDEEIQEEAQVEKTGFEKFKEKLGKMHSKFTNYQGQIEELQAEFFQYDEGTLEQFDPEAGDEDKKVNYTALFKEWAIKILTIFFYLWVIKQYLDTLGTEESQTVLYTSHLFLNYTLSDLPRLLPFHQFASFDTEAVKARIKCKVYQDQAECRKLQERGCETYPKTSEQYEKCIIQLQENLNLNSTQFCEVHYKDTTLWVDNVSPQYLMYYLRMHNCYLTTGVPLGRQYCLDYRDHEDSWSLDNLYRCYTKHHVDFGKEYCDTKFSDDKRLLMQCYGLKNVPKGEEFCIQNFDQPEDRDIVSLIECYESIPLFNKKYCDIKFTDNADLVKCYEEQAKLTLDKAFCDLQYPLVQSTIDSFNGVVSEIQFYRASIYDQRYACYNQIGLSGYTSKGREYCELINLESPSSKYECIESLQAQGIDIQKGGDYCYFKYPWTDLYEERYGCLESEGIPRELLSSRCEEEYHFKEFQAKKNGLEYSTKERDTCLAEYGIPNIDNKCGEYQLMPRGQNYVVKTLEDENVLGYQLSDGKKYKTLDWANSLINNNEFKFFGSHSSFKVSNTEAFHFWVLEQGFEDFLTNSGKSEFSEIKEEEMKESFGQFLVEPDKFENLAELIAQSNRINLDKEKYENPLLEDEEITIQVAVIELAPVDQAAEDAEQLAFALGALQQAETIGQLLNDIDLLIGSKSLPDESSMIAQIQDELLLLEGSDLKSYTELFQEGKEVENSLTRKTYLEFQEIQSDPLFSSLKEKPLTVAVAEQLLVELSLGSPAIKSIIAQYEGPEEQPLVGSLIDEVYKQLEAAEQPAGRRLLAVGLDFTQLTSALQEQPLFSQLISDMGSILEMTPTMLANDGLSTLSTVQKAVSELKIDKIVSEAQEIRQAEIAQASADSYAKENIMPGDVQNLIDQVKETMIGEMIEEYYSIELNINLQLLEDLWDVTERKIDTESEEFEQEFKNVSAEIMDAWIQRNQTYEVIQEIKKVLTISELNEKMLRYDEAMNIYSYFKNKDDRSTEMTQNIETLATMNKTSELLDNISSQLPLKPWGIFNQIYQLDPNFTLFQETYLEIFEPDLAEPNPYLEPQEIDSFISDLISKPYSGAVINQSFSISASNINDEPYLLLDLFDDLDSSNFTLDDWITFNSTFLVIEDIISCIPEQDQILSIEIFSYIDKKWMDRIKEVLEITNNTGIVENGRTGVEGQKVGQFLSTIEEQEVFEKMVENIYQTQTQKGEEDVMLELEEVERFIDGLIETPIAGRLIEEYFTLNASNIAGSDQYVISKLFEEFEYVTDLGMNNSEDAIDTWIMQQTTFQTINDVILSFGIPITDDELPIGSQNISYEAAEKLKQYFLDEYQEMTSILDSIEEMFFATNSSQILNQSIGLIERSSSTNLGILLSSDELKFEQLFTNIAKYFEKSEPEMNVTLEPEEVERFIDGLIETPIAGQLIEEYFTLNASNIAGSDQYVISKLFEEFEYVTDLGMNNSEDAIDTWIMQKTTFQAINDVISCFEIPITEDELPIGSQNISYMAAEQILWYFEDEDQEMMSSTLDSIEEMFYVTNSTQILNQSIGILERSPSKNLGLFFSSDELQFEELSINIVEYFSALNDRNDPQNETNPSLEPQEVERYLQELKQTPSAGLLIQEFYTLNASTIQDGEMINQLINDLGNFVSENMTEVLDEWIVQENTFRVINDVISTFGSLVAENGTRPIGSQNISMDVAYELLKYFDSQTIDQAEEMFYATNSTQILNQSIGILDRSPSTNLGLFLSSNNLEYLDFFSNNLNFIFGSQDPEPLTPESMETLFLDLQSTPFTGQLIKEFLTENATGTLDYSQTIFSKMESDLGYANSQSENFKEMMDVWIQQVDSFQVIEEIIDVLSKSEAREMILTNQTTEEIFSYYSYRDQNTSKAMKAVVELIEVTNTSSILNESQQYFNTTAYEFFNKYEVQMICDDLADRLFVYLDGNDTGSGNDTGFGNETVSGNDTEPQRRRLETTTWMQGQWYFEDINKLVGIYKGQEFKLTLANSKLDVTHNGFTTILSQENFNTYNERHLTFKQAIHEIIGERISLKPSLLCHFSSDPLSPPFLLINLDQPYYVKSLTLFNIQNGAISSNLENSKIYVGDTLCSQIGSTLPIKDYIKLTCEDPSKPKNVFNSGYKDDFKGTYGSSIKIQSGKAGQVLAVCDIKIEVKTIDEQYEEKIDEYLKNCKEWQAKCISDFANIEQAENKYNCLERYGFNKTAQYCIESLRVNSDKFFYKTKNKYECLSDSSNEFKNPQLPDDVGNCLNLYFDYQVEECLINYESHFNNEFGFVGPEAKPSTNNASAYMSRYWDSYGNLTISNVDLVKKEEAVIEKESKEHQEQVVQDVLEVATPINVEQSEVQSFLCENSQMIFYSSPSEDTELLLDMKCEVFEQEKESVIHFYMNSELSLRVNKSTEETANQFYIERTDNNKQFFDLQFTSNLNFLDLTHINLYLREQDPQNEDIDSPFLSSASDFTTFLSNPLTLQVSESSPIVISESQIQNTSLVSTPKYNNSIGVEKKGAWKLWVWPIFFTDSEDDRIVVTPENNARLAMEVPISQRTDQKFSNVVNLKFDFFKHEYEYTFINLGNFFTDLGGVGSLAEETLESFGTILLILFFLDLVMIIKKKHKHDHIGHVQKFKERLPIYKEVIQERMREEEGLEDDLILVNRLIQEEQAQQAEKEAQKAEGEAQAEGGEEKEQEQKEEQPKKETKDEEMVEYLSSLNDKYGKESIKLMMNRNQAEIFDDSNMTHKFLNESHYQSVFETAKRVKRRLSFIGIYFSSITIENTNVTLKSIQLKLQSVVKVLLQQQNLLDNMMSKDYGQAIDNIARGLEMQTEGTLETWRSQQEAKSQAAFQEARQTIKQLMGEVAPPDSESEEEQIYVINRSNSISRENMNEYRNIKAELGKMKKRWTVRQPDVVFEEEETIPENPDQMLQSMKAILKFEKSIQKDTSYLLDRVEQTMRQDIVSQKQYVLKLLKENIQKSNFELATKIAKKIKKDEELDKILSDVITTHCNSLAKFNELREIDQDKQWTDPNYTSIQPQLKDFQNQVAEIQNWSSIFKSFKTTEKILEWIQTNLK